MTGLNRSDQFNLFPEQDTKTGSITIHVHSCMCSMITYNMHSYVIVLGINGIVDKLAMVYEEGREGMRGEREEGREGMRGEREEGREGGESNLP